MTDWVWIPLFCPLVRKGLASVASQGHVSTWTCGAKLLVPGYMYPRPRKQLEMDMCASLISHMSEAVSNYVSSY